jgi:hypothetical protein
MFPIAPRCKTIVYFAFLFLSAFALNAGIFQFSSPAYSGGEKAGAATITVRRTGSLANVETVNFFTSDVSALANIDYAAASGTLTFAANEAFQTFTVSAIDNTLVSSNKILRLTLTDPVGGSLGLRKNATLTILNDDLAGAFKLASNQFSVSENITRFLAEITRINGDGGDVQVRFSTQPGSGRAGVHYEPVNTVLTFAAGETKKIVPIAIFDNAIVSGDKNFRLLLSKPSLGSTLADPKIATVFIRDDDSSFQFAAATQKTTEGQGVA